MRRRYRNRGRGAARRRSLGLLGFRSRRRLLHRSPWWLRLGILRRLRLRRGRNRFDLYGDRYEQLVRLIALVLSLFAMVVVALVARPAHSQTSGTTNLLSSPSGWPTTGSPSSTTALGLDPTAVFLNPAGLATQDERTLLVQHGLLQFDASWDVAATSVPLPGIGAFGLAAARLGASGLDAYDAQNQPLGTYGYTETALAAGVARRVVGPVYAGTTFKVLSQTLGDVSAAAPALDLGVVYRPPRLRGAQIGATAENVIAGSLDLGGAAPAIDRSFRIGIASPDRKLGRGGSLRGALDLARHGGDGTKIRASFEYTRLGLGSLRAGLDAGHPVFGVGIQYRRYGVDLSMIQGEFETTKQLGIRVAWGEPVSQYEARRRLEYAKAAEESLRVRYAARRAQDRARAEEAERAGDFETSLVLWEVLRRDLPNDQSIGARADQARARIAERAQSDVAAESGRRLTATLADLAAQALNRGDVEEAAGLTRALSGNGPRPTGAAGESLLVLETKIAAERDRAADRAAARAESLQAEGHLLLAAGEAALALRLRPGDARAQALWNALEGTLTKSASEASQLARRLQALDAVHEASLAFNEGRYEDASKAVKRALQADPSSAEAKDWSGRIARRLSTPKPELDARVKVLYIKGMEAFTAGEYKEALRNWEQILVLDPLNESARRNVLEARERMKSEARR
jgi:tetratricopeptide (TPR) repeat protein